MALMFDENVKRDVLELYHWKLFFRLLSADQVFRAYHLSVCCINRAVRCGRCFIKHMITTDDLCLGRPRGSQDDGQPPPATGSAPFYWCHEKTEAALRRPIKPRQQLARCPPQPPLALWLLLCVSAPQSRCISIHLEMYKLWIVKTPRARTSILKTRTAKTFVRSHDVALIWKLRVTWHT